MLNAVKDDDNTGVKVILGCHVLLCDVDTGEEIKCKIVDSRRGSLAARENFCCFARR